MKSTQEELDELGEQIDLLQAEIDSIAEELGPDAESSSVKPARRKFLDLRGAYLKKSLDKLQERRVAKIRYAEWDRRTRP